MSPVIIIPARLQSTRFPSKPLAMINGRELVLTVADIASTLLPKKHVYIATDSDKIGQRVADAGYQILMTSPNNLTGTDRVAEAATKIDADFIINIQGDEPMVSIADIQKVVDTKISHPNMVVNAFCKLDGDQDPTDPNMPKVVFNKKHQLLYISRAAIPGVKNGLSKEHYRQVCIYAFTHQELQKFSDFGRKSKLEIQEDIEILRFLELGIGVQMVEVDGGSLAVDRPEDVDKVEAAIRKQKYEKAV